MLIFTLDSFMTFTEDCFTHPGKNLGNTIALEDEFAALNETMGRPFSSFENKTYVGGGTGEDLGEERRRSMLDLSISG